jgi:hypothetical protein
MNTDHAQAQIQSIYADVTEGNVNALEAYISLKALASELEDIIDTIQPLAIQAASQHGGKRFTISGVTVEKREGTRRWSYPEFTPYNQAKAKTKELEKLMQTVALSGSILADAETGEIVPAAVCTFSKETIAILTGSK